MQNKPTILVTAKYRNAIKFIILVFSVFQFNMVFSQKRPTKLIEAQDSTVKTEKELSKKVANKTAKIQDYLIISHTNDTTFVDTTLTIKKEYKFNYLRSDNFGLLPFSNMGQTYNSLSYNFKNTHIMPAFGAQAKHFNYMEVQDINYYRVPTPLTELFFKTAFEQGQLADSFFTVNTSPQFNFSIAYKGLRSLGKYQHILASSGNFRFTTNYQTKNNRYVVRTHIVTQDILNQENGGIIDANIQDFETGDPEFLDRSIFEVNFVNAESMLRGKRVHLDHSLNIVNKKDSLAKNELSLRHILSFEDKYYEFNQTTANSFFGTAFKNSKLKDRATLENFYNQLQLNYNNSVIGNLQFNLSSNQYNYGYNKVVILQSDTITNRLKGDVFSVGGKYHKQYKGFDLLGELGINVTGNFNGNYVMGTASFKLNKNILALATLNHHSKAPNYTALLYQSDYINYNWQNNFNNTETQQLAFQIKYKEFADIQVDYSTITNYVYFKNDESSNQIKPFQYSGTLNYLRIKLQNEVTFGKFALDNTILYQNTQNTNGVLNIPALTTRNTLYFSSHLFNKAMYFQTGVILNYFTAYYMNAYNPLIAEFYVQNDTQYGDFPRLDLFINAKIRQTRIYLKAEHFNAAFTGYNYYSAPNNPYRDFIVRFGVVWNFFL